MRYCVVKQIKCNAQIPHLAHFCASSQTLQISEDKWKRKTGFYGHSYFEGTTSLQGPA